MVNSSQMVQTKESIVGYYDDTNTIIVIALKREYEYARFNCKA
jgi:hypothetical protein